MPLFGLQFLPCSSVFFPLTVSPCECAWGYGLCSPSCVCQFIPSLCDGPWYSILVRHSPCCLPACSSSVSSSLFSCVSSSVCFDFVCLWFELSCCTCAFLFATLFFGPWLIFVFPSCFPLSCLPCVSAFGSSSSFSLKCNKMDTTFMCWKHYKSLQHSHLFSATKQSQWGFLLLNLIIHS